MSFVNASRCRTSARYGDPSPSIDGAERLLLGRVEVAPLGVELRLELGERRLVGAVPVLERRGGALRYDSPEPMGEQHRALRVPGCGLEERPERLADVAARLLEALRHIAADIVEASRPSRIGTAEP